MLGGGGGKRGISGSPFKNMGKERKKMGVIVPSSSFTSDLCVVCDDDVCDTH